MWPTTEYFFFLRDKKILRVKKKYVVTTKYFFFIPAPTAYISCGTSLGPQEKKYMRVVFHVRHLCLFNLTRKENYFCVKRDIFVCAAGLKKFSS
jgi:hypothetical protein